MIARRLLLLALAAAAGCAGGPFDRASRTGDPARPETDSSRRKLFDIFDSRPARLEVAPTDTANPLKAEQVLVATVYDADGKPARREKVEWHLDGPGHFAAVDEEGFLASRGRKVDSKSAVGYTASSDRTHQRGDNPKDDIIVGPGQTWVVVTSAVEGLTTVTASLPGASGEKGSVVTRLTWSDSQFRFPKPVVSRPGGSADLQTTLSRYQGKENPDDLRVRYRVLDGAPATLVGSGGSDREAEVPADADGRAGVRVVQASPAPGRTRIAVEVVKPDPAGVGPGTVVGRQETSVEWAAAELTFEVIAPKAAAADRDAEFRIVVANVGKSASLPVTVRTSLPDGAAFVRSDPPSQQAGALGWNLGALDGGRKETITVVLRSATKGPLTLAASAETADGMKAEHRASTDVGAAALRVLVEVPEVATPGERIPAVVAVTNPSGVPAENVTAWLALDAGLSHASGKNPAEVAVGTVAPGETKRVDVPLTAKQSGRYTLRVNATADGGLTDRAEVGVEVRRSGLSLALSGPERLAIGEDGTWTLDVTNTGDGPVSDAVVKVRLPREVTARTATDGGRVAGTDGAEWRLDTLAAGEKRSLKLTAAGDRAGERAVLSASATAGGQSATAEATVAVAGQPAIVLEVTAPPSGLAVGRKATVRVTVRNRGTGPARKVAVSAAATGGLSGSGGTGADRRTARTEGGRVTFGVIDELPAGSSAVYLLEVEGAKPGPARVQVEVRAEHLKQPLRDEQAGRVAASG